MNELLDRLLNQPFVIIIAGVVLGFWAIGEVSRHTDDTEVRERAQTMMLKDIQTLLSKQQQELEALRRQLNEPQHPKS